MVLEKQCNVYKVSDINRLGDQAQPFLAAPKNYIFVIDSFLSPTNGYTDTYGIFHAKRLVPYFTFFELNGDYLAIAVVGDGRFSIEALRQQGALSVTEEIAKDERDSKTDVGNFLSDLVKALKPALFIGIGIFAVKELLPLLKKKQNA